MRKIMNYICKFEDLFAIFILSTVLIIPFFQILERKMHFSIFGIWGQEAARYLFIYLVYIGIAIATRSQSHVSMNFILNKLNSKIKIIIEIVNQFIFLSFCIVMFYLSMRLVIISFKMMDITPAAGLPMYLIFLSLPLGFVLSSLHLILIIYEKIINNKMYGKNI